MENIYALCAAFESAVASYGEPLRSASQIEGEVSRVNVLCAHQRDLTNPATL